MKLIIKTILTLLILISIPLSAEAATYTYDSLGRLESVTYNNGQTVSYSYDSGGNLLKVNAKKPDTVAPTIDSTDPADGGTVPLDKIIKVIFSEPVAVGDNFNGITIKAGSTNLEYTYSLDDRTLWITPSALSYSTEYTLTIPAGAVKDLAGNPLTNNYSISFTTDAQADIITPIVHTTNPTNQAAGVPIDQTVTINFSENIEAGANFTAISFKVGETHVDFTGSISGQKLTLDPINDLSYETTFVVTIPAGAVKNVAGNALAKPYTFSFTTAAERVDTENTVFNRIIVFVDSNRNGVYDQGEQVVSGVKVGFNNIYDSIGISLVSCSDENGRVEFINNGTIDWYWDYYLELLEIPSGLETTPEGNSLFGPDGKTGYKDIEINAKNEVIKFGLHELVHIPLVMNGTCTINIVTADTQDNSVLYEGVIYELYQYQEGGFRLIDTQTSNANGVCQFFNVKNQFDVYLRAVNLPEKGLIPYSFLGADGYSAYITLMPQGNDFLVTLYTAD